jgi:hypothetical protein
MNGKYVLKTQSMETPGARGDVLLKGTKFKYGYGQEYQKIIFIISLYTG